MQKGLFRQEAVAHASGADSYDQALKFLRLPVWLLPAAIVAVLLVALLWSGLLGITAVLSD